MYNRHCQLNCLSVYFAVLSMRSNMNTLLYPTSTSFVCNFMHLFQLCQNIRVIDSGIPRVLFFSLCGHGRLVLYGKHSNYSRGSIKGFTLETIIGKGVKKNCIRIWCCYQHFFHRWNYPRLCAIQMKEYSDESTSYFYMFYFFDCRA